MDPSDFTLPEPVRLRAESQGTLGQGWLDGLAGAVASLSKDWGFSGGRVMSGGSGGLVLSGWQGRRPGGQGEGQKVVMKLLMPLAEGDSWPTELRVLERAGGRGYARLLAADDSRRALLLEHLGAPLAGLGLSTEEQILALTDTLKVAWIEMDGPGGFMTGAEKARWLAQFIAREWQRRGRPCSKKTIDVALSFAALREAAHDPSISVLAHGDPHEFNALSTDESSTGDFKFIDPDGLFAEPAYDLGIVLRGWTGELKGADARARAERYCSLMAERTDVAFEAIWQWGFVERVSTGLHLMEIGMQKEGLSFLEAAERLMK